VSLTRMAGASVAISIYGAVLSAMMAREKGLLPEGLDVETLTPAELAALPQATQTLIAQVYDTAFQPVFLTMAGIVAIGFVASLALRNVLLPSFSKTK
jgi:hypothetical protein